MKRFCFSFSNPRSECHKMSDSKPCSCVCLFSINQPYVLILKSRSALIFSCRIQESVFCETSRLALRDPGEINGQSRTRHTILRPRKTLCCFPAFLLARSSAKCKNKFASHLSSKIKNGKLLTVVKTFQQMPKNTSVAKCHQMFPKSKVIE